MPLLRFDPLDLSRHRRIEEALRAVALRVGAAGCPPTRPGRCRGPGRPPVGGCELYYGRVWLRGGPGRASAPRGVRRLRLFGSPSAAPVLPARPGPPLRFRPSCALRRLRFSILLGDVLLVRSPVLAVPLTSPAARPPPRGASRVGSVSGWPRSR